MFIVAPNPPEGSAGFCVLYTSNREIPCDDIAPKSKALPPAYSVGATGIVRPFKVTILYCAPIPLTETSLPSILLLSIAIPEIRANASAIFPSGNLPTSSAVIISVTPTLFLLISIASIRLLLIPVVTISSTSVVSPTSEVPSSASCATAKVESGNKIATIKVNKYLYIVVPRKINIQN